LALLGALALPAGAAAANSDPLFVFTPKPPPPPNPPKPPPNGYLNAPCGLAVDSIGRIYISDYNHDAVDVFTAGSSQASLPNYVTQLAAPDSLDGPCNLALDGSNHLYVNDYHRRVLAYGAAPGFGAPTTIAGAGVDQTHPTGVAVDKASGRLYVDARTYIAVYDSSGSPIEEAGKPLQIGEGTLKEGYGLAVSSYPASAGYLYVPDAATNTVKVYDPAGADKGAPVASIAGPPGGFVSLRDSAVAVDDKNGQIYVIDNTQPKDAEQPRANVEVFGAGGAYLGRLRYQVTDGAPAGLAVDNSGGANQGHVYVTSGNTHEAGLYAYGAGAASASALAPSIPALPLGGERLTPQIPIGGPAPGGTGTQIACTGDACQVLPPEPVDPTLTTLLAGPGNPKVRYSHRQRRHCKKAARRCGHSKRRRGTGARASVARATAGAPAGAAEGSIAAAGAASSGQPSAAGLLPGAAGFSAEVRTEGAAATLAGSHPYRLGLGVGLDPGEELRSARFELAPGMLADPAAASLCSAGKFATPRSSPFESSLSGESCPDRSQVGTIELDTALGSPRRFGLFNLNPAPGAAAELAASPYGIPLRFEAQISSDSQGAHLSLEAQIPQGLELHGFQLALWGTPMDASHDGERGNCLDQPEAAFPWARCSVGEPLTSPPLPFLTLPTACSPTLAFDLLASSYQQPASFTAQALNREEGGTPAPVSDCAALNFKPDASGFLTTRKASSASGFLFRLSDADPGLSNPRLRVHSLARGAVVRLPRGVTLNPSLGAGLGVCSLAQYEAESAVSPQGSGCPNAAKIGDFIVRSPFYEGFLEGSVYLAAPHQNPFGSLLAVYLLAKAADRGIVVKAAGRLDPDPADGTLTATFDQLPQLPYTDLEVNIRSGQRAPLVSPDACGTATTQISMTPWAQGAPSATAASDSPIETGVDSGPCPAATPPFAPEAIAGGVNWSGRTPNRRSPPTR
jgi:DNA-binding beta-propeller fold protein YncE